MTEKKRIFLNIVATYGRSLYGLVLGLFCGRWALLALGEIDYGLYGLVGGLTVFISFFNNILAGANSRFYAFSVGAAQVANNKQLALEECRRWFNVALGIHSVIPLIVVAIGYPIGVIAIEKWLTIPADRVIACIWVFRFFCVSCFVAMINVPFTAMYTAKQYIAELTIYSFATSTLNVIALYYMVTHATKWLVPYAAWMCLLGVVPQILICIRAIYIFPECRVKFSYMWDWCRLRQIVKFSFWQAFGNFCGLLRTQGISIVVNKFFGAAMNAAQTIGTTVQGHCASLASAMQGAFVPVITQACGAGDYDKMNLYVIRTCKFNVILSAVFMLPLSLELPSVLHLWLKDPPAFSVGLCYCAIAYYMVGACTVGHMVAVNASGRIAGYHTVLSLVNVFTVPIAVITGIIWRNVYMVMGVVVFMELINSIGRVIFARIIVGTSVRAWVKSVCIPSLGAALLSVVIGNLARQCFRASVVRVCVTTILCELVFLPFVWCMMLTVEERRFIINKIVMARDKFRNIN